ncbi:hypothetical protein niasHT_009171 [Heterodera trifolii]|uniref:Uncharacterized protein n=1 Tax=Heterodera trifolii TaxID=157864 RepID=A0ABD2ME49_9BILA
MTPCDCSPVPFRASLAVVDAVENGSSTGYTLKSEAPPRQWAENVSHVAAHRLWQRASPAWQLPDDNMWRSAGACIRIKPSVGILRVLVEMNNDGTKGNYCAFLYAIVRKNRRATQQNGGGQRMMTSRTTLMLLIIELIWLP